jgi:hypothetical protein
VDDLIEHCEEIPTPAQMQDAIRRYNVSALDEKYQRKQENERQEWPKLYGAPEAILGNNCIACGEPWSEIFEQIRRGMAEEATLSKEFMQTGCKDWGAARSMARKDLLRRSGSNWRHSETCAGRGALR